MPEVLEKITKRNENLFSPNENFDIGDFRILHFSIPHDAANPCGFNIYYGDQKLVLLQILGI